MHHEDDDSSQDHAEVKVDAMCLLHCLFIFLSNSFTNVEASGGTLTSRDCLYERVECAYDGCGGHSTHAYVRCEDHQDLQDPEAWRSSDE